MDFMKQGQNPLRHVSHVYDIQIKQNYKIFFFFQMIKQESENQYNDQSRYKHMGKTFTVNKKGKIFVFKIHDEVTGERYESQQVMLDKINEKTIKAAFDPKITSVTRTFCSQSKDQLLQQHENNFILRFIIKINHISTQFKQDIKLLKIQKNKEFQMKYYYDQVKEEISIVQKMLYKQLTPSNNQLILQTERFNLRNDAKYEFQPNTGNYILKITGCYVYQNAYTGNYDNQYYDDNQNIINLAQGGVACPPLIVSIYLDDYLLIELTSTDPSFIGGNQYQFTLSTILKLNKKKKVILLFRLKNQGIFNINQCLVTALPFSHAF